MYLQSTNAAVTCTSNRTEFGKFGSSFSSSVLHSAKIKKFKVELNYACFEKCINKQRNY